MIVRRRDEKHYIEELISESYIPLSLSEIYDRVEDAEQTLYALEMQDICYCLNYGMKVIAEKKQDSFAAERMVLCLLNNFLKKYRRH